MAIVIATAAINGLILGYNLPDRQGILMKNLCAEFNIKLIEPLFNKDAGVLLKEIVRLGFKAIISEIDTTFFDKRWLGRIIDKKFIGYLDDKPKFKNKRGINALGDRGEYHTLVIDGPIFRKKINIQEARGLYKGNSAWLNIKKYKLVNKKVN